LAARRADPEGAPRGHLGLAGAWSCQFSWCRRRPRPAPPTSDANNGARPPTWVRIPPGLGTWPTIWTGGSAFSERSRLRHINTGNLFGPAASHCWPRRTVYSQDRGGAWRALAKKVQWHPPGVPEDVAVLPSPRRGPSLDWSSIFPGLLSSNKVQYPQSHGLSPRRSSRQQSRLRRSNGPSLPPSVGTCLSLRPAFRGIARRNLNYTVLSCQNVGGTWLSSLASVALRSRNARSVLVPAVAAAAAAADMGLRPLEAVTLPRAASGDRAMVERGGG